MAKCDAMIDPMHKDGMEGELELYIIVVVKIMQTK